MPSAETFQSRYTVEQLIELRRKTLRYARSFRLGDERDRHRQVAASLRALLQNNGWLQAHTLNGPLIVDPVDPFHFGTNARRPYWCAWCALSAESGRLLKLHTCRH